MTAKHNSKFARQALWVAKHRAASAKSDPKKREQEAREHTQLSKTRASRAMGALLAGLGTDEKPATASSDEKPAEDSVSPETPQTDSRS
jgi:hypothetical protein